MAELKRIAFLIDNLGFRAHDAEVAIGEDADAIVAAEDGQAIFLRSIALDITALRAQLTEAQRDTERLETFGRMLEHAGTALSSTIEVAFEVLPPDGGSVGVGFGSSRDIEGAGPNAAGALRGALDARAARLASSEKQNA